MFQNDNELVGDDDNTTIVDDEMLQMVNDAYQCLNEIINESYENEGLESIDVISYANNYKNLIEDSKIPLYSGCIYFTNFQPL